VNRSTFRAYVHGESLQRLTEVFDREGAAALAIAMDSQIMLFADSSVVESFWYGIAGAIGIVVVLGAFIGWMIRRALLFEVQEISGTASANQ
jgi:hypothetical protein